MSFSAWSQKNLEVDWTFHTGSIYNRAFDEYLILTKQKFQNPVNYDSQLPTIGIYLVNFKTDSMTQTELIEVRFCLDDSWEENEYDYFYFFGSKLLLINRNSGNYISQHDLREIIQDRVFSRRKKVERKILSEGITARDKITFDVDRYDGWHYKGEKTDLLRKPPYYLREIEIDHTRNRVFVK